MKLRSLAQWAKGCPRKIARAALHAPNPIIPRTAAETGVCQAIRTAAGFRNSSRRREMPRSHKNVRLYKSSIGEIPYRDMLTPSKDRVYVTRKEKG